MFRRLAICLTLTLAPLAAQSAGITIAGSVVDAGLTPLSGAVVTLTCPASVERKATTATDGTFTLQNVPAGTCQVRAERTAFPAFIREVRVPSGARRIQLPIVMSRPSDRMPAAEMSTDTSTRSTATPSAAPRAPMPVAPPPPPTLNTPVASGGSGGRGGGAQGQAGSTAGGVAIDRLSVVGRAGQSGVSAQPYFAPDWSGYPPPPSGESYAHVEPNRFHTTTDQPLSTFGADVDTASYTNIRRFLSMGQLPPSDAVRVEELINYFRFNYADPAGGRPVGITTEIGDCPWAPSHKLVLIGARASAPPAREIAGRNIVLLIDVSGSMSPPERLPLIKTALAMFVDTLRADDRLAIVTYAGSSGVALHSTPVRNRETIQRAIANLNAGGSTNGGQGLILAYRLARESFIPGGVNRVILATDGDFNVGIVNQRDLVTLIERESDSGVFLSVFGVGSGNLKDSTMEMLADRGNGHYAYIDTLQEARRVLVREGDATLETVAKDVKFQVEFNPAVVGAWKLIGYENRRLAARDFNDDRKDAGDMGAGHTVTVLYEVIPAGSRNSDDPRDLNRPAVDPLKYQPPAPAPRPQVAPSTSASSGEWLTVKVRYKAPDDDTSQLITHPVRAAGQVQHLPFAAAVAEFGLMLRDQAHDLPRWDGLSRRVARMDVPRALASDKDGFAELVAIAAGLSRR